MSLLFSFVVSLGIPLILTVPTMILARKFGFVDDPKRHDHPAILHKKIIPRAGGIPIFLAFVISTFLVLEFSQQILGIIIGGLILVAVGVVDDKYDLNNFVKLAFQVIAALIVVASGVGINFIPNPFFAVGSDAFNFGEVIRLDMTRFVFDFLGTHSIVVWADLFAIFWIVWVINMVNFSTGVDGQMPGIVIVALFIIFAASLRFYSSDPGQVVVAKLAIIGVGATLGFLFYNFNPAKIFPGDSGSYFLGFLVAVLAILSGAKVGAAVLVMAIPLIDGVFTIVRRIAGGKSPFSGDKKHLHHRLLEKGFSVVQIALFYWLLCAILGAIALLLPSGEKVFAGIVVAIIVLGGLLWLNLNLPQKVRE